MYRVNTKITFTQQNNYRDSNGAMKPRSGVLIFNFVHTFEILSTWNSLTDDGEIILPKNVYVTDKNGRRQPLGGSNINIGGFSDTPPVFLRGDKVKIESGYIYYDSRGNEIAPLATVFDGYVSEVTSKKPITLKVEDAMFVLKQTPARGLNGKTFFPAKDYTVEKLVSELFKAAGLPFTVNELTSTSVGDFWTNNETIAEVLARFQKDYHFESYFRGNELRVGSWPYLEIDAIASGKKLFKFQQNIIEDDLEYRRKDDIVLSAVVSNTIQQTTGETTKDGKAKTKSVKLEALITYENGASDPKVIIASKDKPLPPNTGGERHSFIFYGAKTIDELVEQGKNKLRQYYYTGFKGKFKTFGIPYVQFGDNVDILDPVLPERNGRYKVKSVKYNGGIDGNRQEIELDYLIGRLDANGNFIGLN